MRPPASQQPLKDHKVGLIVISGLFSGVLITGLVWLKLPTQWIHSLSWFSLGLIGLGSFLYFRKPVSPRRRSLVILAALAAVSLVYLFPEILGPTCTGIPRAFASPAQRCGRCIDFVCEWNDKKNQEHCYCNEWDDSECPGTITEPPDVEADLTCASWGLNGWCAGAYTLDVTATEPQGLNVMISGDILGAEFACPATAATSTCSAPLPQGKGTATFTATSVTGLSAPGSAYFKHDSLKPQINGLVNGTTGNNGWYVSTVKVSASATDPTPGSGLAALDYNLDGAGWQTFVGPLSLSDGVHSLNLRASDVAGKHAFLYQVIQIDTVTPTLNLSLTGVKGSNGWYRSNLELTAAASDGGSGLSAFEYDLDNAGWMAYTSPLGMGEGIHTLSLRGVDAAGNNTTWTNSFQVDTLAPLLDLSAVGAAGLNGWYTSPLQVTLAASDSDSPFASGLGSLEYNLDGAGWAGYTAPLDLGDGVHTLELRASDLAGNPVNGTQTYLVDTLPPALDVNLNGTRGAGSWYVSVVQVEAVASDTGSALGILEAQIDGGDWTPYTGPLAFGDGPHTYHFRATDNAGNLAEIPLQEFYVDTIPPVISLPALWDLGDGANFQLLDEGSGLANVRLVIEDEAGRYPKVTRDDALESFSFDGQINWNGRFEDGTLAPPNGKYFATLIVSDNAGNESRATGQIKVPLIVIAPTSTSPSTPTPTSSSNLTPTASAVPTATRANDPAPTDKPKDVATQAGSRYPVPTWTLVSQSSQTNTPLALAKDTLPTATFVTGTDTGTTKDQTILTIGGGNSDTLQTPEIHTFKTDNSDKSSKSSTSSNVLWAATASAAIGAFTAEILRRKEREAALERERVARKAAALERAEARRENSDYRQQIRSKKEAELEAKWEAERILAEQRNQQRILQTSEARVTRKEAEIEAEMSSYTKEAQELGPSYYNYFAQKALERFREQERETPEAIGPQNEKKSPKSWLEERILETALSLNLERYSEKLEVIEDSLISIGDMDRNPRIASAHEQTWAAIDAWEAIFQMRNETKEFTTDAIKNGHWEDAFRGVTALVKQNLTVSAGAVAAGAIAAWGVVTTPVRIFTQDIQEFTQAGKERMEGKDRFWDVLFTGTNLAGDVTALYGGYQAAGKVNIVNKINSSAADHIGIGRIQRVYKFGTTEYVYKFNPYKKAALGYLEDLKGVTPKDFNLLKDIPDEIYGNTSIQLDFLTDIANSKINPRYMSDPRLFDDRVFSRVEHNFLETVRKTYPDWWTTKSGANSESILNGFLSYIEGDENVNSSIFPRQSP